MQSFLSTLAAATAFAAVSSAQTFNVIGQIYTGTPGETYSYRTWYGDGNMYIGTHVPEDVESAFNFTIPDWTGTVPQVLIRPVPPATGDELPEGTFIAINNATGATDPVIFTNDEDSLGEDYIWNWLRYGTFIVPKNPGGSSSTETHFYLAETEEEDTFKVTWRTPGAPVEGLQRINLTAVL
jgi:hypothetical protein